MLHVRRVPEIVAGFIQNYFLRKRMHKISAKKGIFGTKTLILALFGPFQALFVPLLTLLIATVVDELQITRSAFSDADEITNL